MISFRSHIEIYGRRLESKNHCSNVQQQQQQQHIGWASTQHYKKCNQLAMFFSHQTRYFSEIRGHSFDPYPIQEWLIEYLFKSLGVKVRHPKVRYLVYSQTILDGYLVIQAFCGFPNKMLTQLRNGPWLARARTGLAFLSAAFTGDGEATNLDGCLEESSHKYQQHP